MRRSRRLIVLVILITVPLALIGLTFGRRLLVRNEAPTVRGVPVRVMHPFRSSIERNIRYSGNLIPEKTITVFSKITGKIDRTLVDLGQSVEKNQRLALIEDESLMFRLNQAYSSWQAAEAQYEKALKGIREQEIGNARAIVDKAEKDLSLAQENYDRTKRLYENGAVSKARFEEMEAVLRAAQTAVDNAARTLKLMEEGATEEELAMVRSNAAAMKAQYDLAKLQADYAEIKAPEEGIVAEILVDEGNMVGQTVPILVIIQDDPILARIAIPEKYYSELIAHPEELEARILPIAYPDLAPFVGKIRHIDTVLDPTSRTFDLEIAVENSARLLRPGMYVNAEIILEVREDALLVPVTVLLKRNDREVVFVAVFEDENFEKAEMRLVQVGLKNTSFVQIVHGVSKDDRVITEGNTFLEDGQEIRTLAAP
jgi:RND family efflux transporter MFP subunit